MFKNFPKSYIDSSTILNLYLISQRTIITKGTGELQEHDTSFALTWKVPKCSTQYGLETNPVCKNICIRFQIEINIFNAIRIWKWVSSPFSVKSLTGILSKKKYHILIKLTMALVRSCEGDKPVLNELIVQNLFVAAPRVLMFWNFYYVHLVLDDG